MIRQRRLPGLGLLVAAMLAVASHARATEHPRDFANVRPITLDAADALHVIELPRTVYEGLARPDLADVRVFNGNDEPVPHALLPRESKRAVEPARAVLPLFPLRGPAGTAPDALDLRIDRTEGRTTIRVVTPAGATTGTTPQQPVLCWIADASALDEPVRAFVLGGLPDGTLARLRIEASDDLRQWRVVATDQTVATLRADAATIERTRIEFPPTLGKYWRITGVPAIGTLTAEAGDIAADAPRTWKRLVPTTARAGEGEYEFDAAGRFPADRFRIQLPDANTVARVQLLARARASDPWRDVTRGTAYRMTRDGVEVTSPALEAPPAGLRFWMIRVDARGGGIGAGMPALELGWVPDRLVFVARGGPPFALAFGNHHATSTAFAVDQFQPGWRPGERLRATVARLEPDAPAAGSAGVAPAPVTLPPERPFDARTAALYAALALGVLVLAAMAWALARRMRAAPESGPGGG